MVNISEHLKESASTILMLISRWTADLNSISLLCPGLLWPMKFENEPIALDKIMLSMFLIFLWTGVYNLPYLICFHFLTWLTWLTWLTGLIMNWSFLENISENVFSILCWLSLKYKSNIKILYLSFVTR